MRASASSAARHSRVSRNMASALETLSLRARRKRSKTPVSPPLADMELGMPISSAINSARNAANADRSASLAGTASTTARGRIAKSAARRARDAHGETTASGSHATGEVPSERGSIPSCDILIPTSTIVGKVGTSEFRNVVGQNA